MQGAAQQLIDFAQPLLEGTARTEADIKSALSFAQFLWNVALEREAQEEMLGAILPETSPAERERVENIAREMLLRHREMFPELHAGAD